MKFDPQIHHRRSIRLKDYDYALAGAYFITIDTWHTEPLVGTVVNGEMHLKRLGRIVLDACNDLPNHYPHIELDAFCVMPDHVHGVIVLIDPRAGRVSAITGVGALPEMVISGSVPRLSDPPLHVRHKPLLLYRNTTPHPHGTKHICHSSHKIG